MASVNKVILVGNLGRDPEVRSFPSGDRVANVTIATSHRWKDKQTSEMREATEWHRIVFNGRLAEIVEQYLRKGSQIYVEGSLHTRKWTDRDGIEKYTTEIWADQMQMTGSRQGMGASTGGEESFGVGQNNGHTRPTHAASLNTSAPLPTSNPASAPLQAAQVSSFDDMDDDIPF